CGSLRHSDATSKLVTTDSVFAVDQEPEGDHPFVHSKWAVLENGSDLHGELLLAGLTKPQTASRDEGVLVGAASRASDLAARPAEFDCVDKAAVTVGKVFNRFFQGFRRFGCRFHENS